MVYRLFTIGLKQIRRDGMLLFLLPAPFLLGLVFRFFLPLADRLLQRELSFSLEPWYRMTDAFLLLMSPCLVAVVGAFLVLEELDEGLHHYYTITPAGRGNYLAARLFVPMLWALPCSLLVEVLFGLTVLSWRQMVWATLLSTIFGGSLGMLIISFAQNKVEGLAYSKIIGVFALGLPAVWLLKPPAQYLAAWLPSFWIGKILVEPDGGAVFFGLLTSLFWALVFLKRYLAKTYT